MSVSATNNSLHRVGIVIGQLSHGGAEKQTALLAIGLQRAGRLEPIVFCLSNATKPHVDALLAANVPVHIVTQELKRGWPKLRWLIAQVRQAQCDLLFGVLHVGNIYAGMAALALRRPLITSIRNVDIDLSLAIRAISGYFCRRSSCVVANSPSCITSLREDLNVHHQRVRMIPNAMPSLKTSSNTKVSLRSVFGIPSNAIVIGTVALVKSQKRPEFFINVCQEFYNYVPGSSVIPHHFLWIGDGPETDRVTAILAELPVDLAKKIHFAGARSDISDCLVAMDVFVLTSAYEGMPNALLEAMAAGLPCVVTDVPGTRDVFADTQQGEEIGVLASNNDPKVFAEQLWDLIQAPRRMQAIGRNSKSYVRGKFTLEKMLWAYDDVFTHVLSAHRSRKGRLWQN